MIYSRRIILSAFTVSVLCFTGSDAKPPQNHEIRDVLNRILKAVQKCTGDFTDKFDEPQKGTKGRKREKQISNKLLLSNAATLEDAVIALIEKVPGEAVQVINDDKEMENSDATKQTLIQKIIEKANLAARGEITDQVTGVLKEYSSVALLLILNSCGDVIPNILPAWVPAHSQDILTGLGLITPLISKFVDVEDHVGNAVDKFTTSCKALWDKIVGGEESRRRLLRSEEACRIRSSEWYDAVIIGFLSAVGCGILLLLLIILWYLVFRGQPSSPSPVHPRRKTEYVVKKIPTFVKSHRVSLQA